MVLNRDLSMIYCHLLKICQKKEKNLNSWGELCGYTCESPFVCEERRSFEKNFTGIWLLEVKEHLKLLIYMNNENQQKNPPRKAAVEVEELKRAGDIWH